MKSHKGRPLSKKQTRATVTIVVKDRALWDILRKVAEEQDVSLSALTEALLREQLGRRPGVKLG